MRILLLLFIIIPVLEMWLLITVGQQLGALPTIGLVLLTAVIGVNLLKSQSMSTLSRAQQRVSEGGVPAQEMLEGLALGVGGALLLTPGFFTDAIGFACLIPQSRRWIASKLVHKVLVSGMVGGVSTSGGPFSGPRADSQGPAGPFSGSSDGLSQSSDGPNVIEGEYQVENEDKP